MGWTFKVADTGSVPQVIYWLAASVIAAFWGISWCDCVFLPSGVLWFLGALVGVLVAVTLWAAHQNLAQSAGLFACLFGYVLAVFLLVGFGGVWANKASSDWSPPLTSSNPNRLRIIDGRVEIDGDITFALFDAVQQIALDDARIKALSLNSNGGAIHAARGLARLVRENGWNTVASGPCYSACTLVFIAGKRRTLDSQGALGFHSYAARLDTSSGQISLGSPLAEQNADRAAFARAGVAQSFLARMFDAPHEGLWQPSTQELLDSGVLTN